MEAGGLAAAEAEGEQPPLACLPEGMRRTSCGGGLALERGLPGWPYPLLGTEL